MRILDPLHEIYRFLFDRELVARNLEIVLQPISPRLPMHMKLNLLLDNGVKQFNRVVFEFLKTTSYPLGKETDFPLMEKEEVLVREDIFRILEKSGVGVPKYYNKVQFEVDGVIGEYARSRSGCYFCFFQQKIEWVWLYEQHPDLFKMAMAYENQKEGFTWSQNESLEDLMRPERVAEIKREYLAKVKNKKTKSQFLVDILEDSEEEGCAACFI